MSLKNPKNPQRFKNKETLKKIGIIKRLFYAESQVFQPFYSRPEWL